MPRKKKEEAIPETLMTVNSKRIKKVVLTIHDVKLKSGETVATIFGRVDVKSGEETDNLHFMLPLDDNKDFQRHIKSMVKQALDLKYGF